MIGQIARIDAFRANGIETDIGQSEFDAALLDLEADGISVPELRNSR